MTQSSISVALCTRNGEQFVGEQLQSIFAQTLPPEEIVISDDASSDGTLSAARRAADEAVRNFGAAPRLRIVENATPLGVARNFEQAAIACRGDLIALSDQDDRWRPERLARMASEFEARPDLLLLHSDARLIDSAGADLGRSLFYAYEVKRFEIDDVHRGRAFDALLRRNLATGATILFRRSLLQHAAPFPPHWLHDEWLAIVAAAIGRVDLLEEMLIDYRQHDSNQIGAERENFAAKVRRAIAPRGAKYRERVERPSIFWRVCGNWSRRSRPALLRRRRESSPTSNFEPNCPPTGWSAGFP